VSVALAKLRHHFGNPLFVRTSNGMEPTPFSEGLVQPVREAARGARQGARHRSEFDPATSRRTFRICMTDISQLVLLPATLGTPARHGARHCASRSCRFRRDTARLLESGEADLAMGFVPQLEAGFYQQTLFVQSFVCMVGRDHPRIGEALSLASTKPRTTR
jgi:DNA-binding transcriptional LysR family regulator